MDPAPAPPGATPEKDSTVQRDPRVIAMSVSLGASVLMLLGKGTAYFLTHSTAIFSDFAESVVHGAATGLAAFSLWYAAKPADPQHPYGHGRIAYFSAGFEGALVCAAAIAVLWSAVHGIIFKPELRNLGLGMGIAAGLAGFNLVLGTALVRIGKRHRTLILVANGRHVLSDVWTTVAALAGVGLVQLTGQTWVDPIAALVIGGIILKNGIDLVRESYAGLMDEVEPELADKLSNALQEQVDDGQIAGFHQLRVREVHNDLWVDVHVLVPGMLSMHEAHRRVTSVEKHLAHHFPEHHVEVMTHMEPIDHEQAHPGGHDGVADPLG